MASNTKIEWTANRIPLSWGIDLPHEQLKKVLGSWQWRFTKDELVLAGATFSPWWGCVEVSEGCDHCYARTFDKRLGGSNWGKEATRRFFGDKHWNEPVIWNEKGRRLSESLGFGVRLRVFCASMADVFEVNPLLDAERQRLFDLIEATPYLDWLLLTKRPQNMVKMTPRSWSERWPKNAWALTTVESQEYTWRIKELAKVPAVVRGLSVEPMIGPIELEARECGDICWLIVGGESGHGARPMHPDWARSLQRSSKQYGVAYHFKQWGEWLHRSQVDFMPQGELAMGAVFGQTFKYHQWGDGSDSIWLGKKDAGRLLDGVEHNEAPVSVW